MTNEASGDFRDVVNDNDKTCAISCLIREVEMERNKDTE